MVAPPIPEVLPDRQPSDSQLLEPNETHLQRLASAVEPPRDSQVLDSQYSPATTIPGNPTFLVRTPEAVVETMPSSPPQPAKPPAEPADVRSNGLTETVMESELGDSVSNADGGAAPREGYWRPIML